MKKGTEIRTIRATHRGDFYVFIEELRGEDLRIVKPVQFEVMQKRSLFETCEPSVIINNAVAQQLMDDLWDGGLRPSEGTGSAGALAAVQKHLEDMRKIASKKLGVEL